MFVLNFVISGKVTSLPKVIKYVERSKYSFYDFGAKHTPSATLILRKPTKKLITTLIKTTYLIPFSLAVHELPKSNCDDIY